MSALLYTDRRKRSDDLQRFEIRHFGRDVEGYMQLATVLARLLLMDFFGTFVQSVLWKASLRKLQNAQTFECHYDEVTTNGCKRELVHHANVIGQWPFILKKEVGRAAMTTTQSARR